MIYLLYTLLVYERDGILSQTWRDHEKREKKEKSNPSLIFYFQCDGSANCVMYHLSILRSVGKSWIPFSLNGH